MQKFSELSEFFKAPKRREREEKMGMFQNQNSSSQNDYNAPPQQDYDSPFDRIGTSKPSEGGVYPEPGVYPILFVNSLKMIKSRKGEDIFIADFDIIQSDVAERPAGSTMSWVANFKHDAAPGNVRLLLAAIMAVPIADVDANGSKFAVSAENPCYGRLVRMNATMTTTKSGNPFTLCKFSALSENIQLQAKELRHSAGFDAATPF